MRGPNCSLLTAEKCWCVTSKPTLAGDKQTHPTLDVMSTTGEITVASCLERRRWLKSFDSSWSTQQHLPVSCIPAPAPVPVPLHITAYQQCISLHTTTCGPTRSYSTYLAKPIGDLAKVLNAASFCIFGKICKTIDRIQKITSNLHILGRHKISAHNSSFCFQNPAQTKLTF